MHAYFSADPNLLWRVGDIIQSIEAQDVSACPVLVDLLESLFCRPHRIRAAAARRVGPRCPPLVPQSKTKDQQEPTHPLKHTNTQS